MSLSILLVTTELPSRYIGLSLCLNRTSIYNLLFETCPLFKYKLITQYYIT